MPATRYLQVAIINRSNSSAGMLNPVIEQIADLLSFAVATGVQPHSGSRPPSFSPPMMVPDAMSSACCRMALFLDAQLAYINRAAFGRLWR
jgi:hypothetical protein